LASTSKRKPETLNQSKKQKFSMLRQDAIAALPNLKAAVARGYERAVKHGFAMGSERFGDSVGHHKTYDQTKLREVWNIRETWQKQRLDETGGAAGMPLHKTFRFV
jgi:hypothetical protein